MNEETGLKIEGLNQKPRDNVEEIGVFKLKDKTGRNAIEIDFSKAKRPISEAKCLYIVKIQGETNKVRVLIEWKPKEKKSE